MGYGDKEVYTRWSWSSLREWKALSERSGGVPLFHETGVLWMARAEDPLSLATLQGLARAGIPHERVERGELERRWPQVDFGPVTWAVFEPGSGALMARRAVQAVAAEFVRDGGVLIAGRATAPSGRGRAAEVALDGAGPLRADRFVFALGPWLGKVFPQMLGERIFPTRQEVFYFGPPAGDARFAPPNLPVWVDFAEEIYGLPDLEARGVKVALDAHGPPIDPDTAERRVTPAVLARVREFVARRFPALAEAPLVASEVCQYENSSSGDFLIDRHPGFDNVWLVGGGSGHGFKHGPALGEYVAAYVHGGKAVDERFSLRTKEKVQKRAVY
jgi:glycine/D-amino acid oxidase-like deaminating enzyme